jgi:hypothetical protein
MLDVVDPSAAAEAAVLSGRLVEAVGEGERLVLPQE